MGDTTEGQGSKLSESSISSDEKPVEMRCPMCLSRVIKVRETDVFVKNNIVCLSEYYEHYIDSNGDDKLIKFLHPKENKAIPETLHYAPFK